MARARPDGPGRSRSSTVGSGSWVPGTRHRPTSAVRSTRPARSSRRASSTCTATAAWRSSPTAATSPRSARASRPSWSAWTATGSRRSRAGPSSRRSSISTRGSTAGPTSTTTGRASASYLARYDGTVSLNIATLVGNSQLRIAAVGWDDVERGRPGPRPDARHAPRRDGRGRLRPVIRPRLSARQLRPDRGAGGADRRGRSRGRVLPHPRPLSARRSLPRSVPRGDRDRPAGRRARPHHPLLPPRHPPGRPEPMLALVDDARSDGLDVTFDTYPSEWASTRLLIQLPQWIQAGGPGPLKARLADRTARDRVRAEFDRAWGVVRERRRLGGRPARGLPASREPALGEPIGGGRHGGDRPRRARRHLRPAARGGPGRQPGDQRSVGGDPAAVRRPPGRDGRHGQHVLRRQAGARGRTARSPGSWASSSGTRRCSASRRRSAR